MTINVFAIVLALRGRCDETSTRGCHNVALPFTLKSIIRQKKNYGNSSISPCKNIIFKKSSKPKPKSFKIL
jgi:hypothetical protein